ncbi:MAG: germination protein YpeB [Clostridia bacterium]|nr:germination protein YpeB [Clostridia bacterium]
MKKILLFVLIFVLFALLCGVSVAAILESNKALETKLRLENTMQESFQNAVSEMRNLEADLSKILITTNQRTTVNLLSSLALKSAACSQALSKLPIVSTGIQSTLKFTNQLSSYCATILKSFSLDGVLPENFSIQMLQFLETAQKVNAELAICESQVLSGEIKLTEFSPEETDSEGLFGNVDENVIEYPSVIFDGPFSDGQESNTPKEKRAEVSVQQATEFVSSLNLGLEFSKEVKGALPAYEFSAEEKYCQITKNGGMLLMYLSSRAAQESVLTLEQALERALDFANKLNYGKIENVWQEYYGNFIVFNFAPVIDDVIVYPDLFKIKVALDNGEIVGFEGKSYVINHQERTIEDIMVLKEEAAQNLKEDFALSSARKCLISVNNKELLCWEFFGKYKDMRYAVYVSALDGEEKVSFRIIGTDSGQMAM